MSGPHERIEDLFRRESAHLVAALVRLLGPARLALAEDVVHDALVAAMQAWRFAPPEDPKAWILQAAKNRAIDVLRRERRLVSMEDDARSIESALSPQADARNQLAMMFALCDPSLGPETHVTLVLRWLGGFSAAEVARAFLVDVGTIDRRLSRGRARLRELGALPDPSADAMRAAQPSVEHALYLIFNEGYHGRDLCRGGPQSAPDAIASAGHAGHPHRDPESPLSPALCSDALRLAELLLETGIETPRVHALAALFALDAARLPSRLDDEGVMVPLAEQDRTRWDRSLLARGIVHLGASASGDAMTRWHLEAGIALEHARAASLAATDWSRIVAYYNALLPIVPGPIVPMNHAMAVAESGDLALGERLLWSLADDARLSMYSFYWAARADLARRAGRLHEASELFGRAIALATSRAERTSYERQQRGLERLQMRAAPVRGE